MDKQKNRKIFHMQPILCPWISKQPNRSSSWNRNPNAHTSPLTNRFLNSHWINKQEQINTLRTQNKKLPTVQHSSSQFFYFLRLMQLFPDIHPATLHTVLVLCKNDFFYSVDKILYAKKCRQLYKRNLLQRVQKNRNQKSHAQNVKHKAGISGVRQRDNNESVINLKIVDKEATENSSDSSESKDTPMEVDANHLFIIDKPEDLSRNCTN